MDAVTVLPNNVDISHRGRCGTGKDEGEWELHATCIDVENSKGMRTCEVANGY